MKKAHFLVKSEPNSYAWHELVQDQKTTWDGVRNFEARNNLRAMKKGDLVLYYHSTEGKEIVGVARVLSEASPDPTAKGEDWSAVELAPLKALARPVSLSEIKSDPKLSDFALLKRPRLSVVPVTLEQFNYILKLGKTRL